MTKKTQHADARLIELLGGTKAVQKLCDVTPAAVTNWRADGIPPVRMMFLQAKKPKVYAQYQREIAQGLCDPKVPA